MSWRIHYCTKCGRANQLDATFSVKDCKCGECGCELQPQAVCGVIVPATATAVLKMKRPPAAVKVLQGSLFGEEAADVAST